MRTTARRVLVAGLLGALAMPALAAEPKVPTGTTSPAAKPATAEQAQAVTPEVQSIADANNKFAFELYQFLTKQPGNQFFSPISIETALAMTYAGAAGQTKADMAKVLHLGLPDGQVQDGFHTLQAILNSAPDAYQLKIANRLWGANGYAFLPAFLTTTREKYGAELAPVDFAKSEEARATINRWVEEQTNGKIKDLIPSGALNAMTRLVLTNAIYFKGKWDTPFSKSETKDAAFYESKDKKSDVATMYQKNKFRYAAADGVQVLELPYTQHHLSMVILLPTEREGLEKLEKGLTAENVQKWCDSLRSQDVQAYVPKFKMSSEFTMGEVLSAMGMGSAFGGSADFTGISSSEQVNISEVIHKAFVEVGEEGTEAAAATGVVIRALAVQIPKEPVVFRADHPFVFMIRDNRTNAILFLGRVVDPKS